MKQALHITIYYSDREPVGPYEIRVAAQRVKQVRFNDLIDPEVIPLDIDYAAVIHSSMPVVVQFTRFDSSQAENAVATTIAVPVTS